MHIRYEEVTVDLVSLVCIAFPTATRIKSKSNLTIHDCSNMYKLFIRSCGCL